MAVPFENRNFQKELEKKLQELQQQDVKHLYCTAVVHRAAVM